MGKGLIRSCSSLRELWVVNGCLCSGGWSFFSGIGTGKLMVFTVGVGAQGRRKGAYWKNSFGRGRKRMK